MSFWEITTQEDIQSSDPVVDSTDSVVATVKDKVPEIKVSVPDTRPVALVPNISNPVIGYRSEKKSGRGSFQSPEYDLIEIGKIEDTDSYCRQAFNKKVALMFKEGWDLVGKNPRTIKYIKSRFAQIAQATKTPTNMLLRNMGSNLVRKSNSFIVKVRDVKASGGKIRTINGKSTKLNPIAGYFPVPAESMEFEITDNTISRWQQRMPNGVIKEYLARDIVHIFHDRKDGFVFGTPIIIPVVDDIRALRKIEENVELLVYQHLFPLFQYKVGTPEAPASFTEAGEREIDVVKREIMYMPTEGGIVTPERHEIKAIGAEGRALRAEGYVEHFKKRVFAGLGVSAVDMGEGECYDDQTETLTENGWKFYNEIDHLSEKIATFNPNTNKIEFHLANSKYEGFYQGEMIYFYGKHLNIFVTPHHEMWIAPRRKDDLLEWQKVYAKDLLAGQFSEFYMLDSVEYSNDDKDFLDKTNIQQDRYRIILSHPRLVTQENITSKPYCGMTYCYNVPNHLFVTRRCGIIGINGNTANRATSDTMSRNLVDGVKDVQQVLEDAINFEIINELLLESTFGPDVLDEENIVKIKFKEIDVDAQIKKEAHAAQLFSQDVIEHDEARRRMGYEPWVIPSPDEVQSASDTPESYPQWHKSRWKMFELPRLLIQAIDEPWSPLAKEAIGGTTATNMTTKTKTETETSVESKDEVKIQQYIKNKDSFLKQTYEQTRENIIERISQSRDVDYNWIAALIRTQIQTSVSRLQVDQLMAFRTGYSGITSINTHRFTTCLSNARMHFQQRSEYFISRLVNNIISSLKRNLKSEKDVSIVTRAVFDTLEHRVNFIEEVEIKKAEVYGKVMALRDTNQDILIASFISDEMKACPTCKSKSGIPINLNTIILDFIPPHHAGCSCELKQTTQDSVPKDAFIETIEKDKDLFKDATLEECVLSVKKSLRKQYPDWDMDKIKSTAYAICNSKMKGK